MRFNYVDSNDTIIDSQTGREYHTWYEDNLLELLNSISEENEQLKKKLDSKERLIKSYEQYLNDLKEDGVLDD